MSALRSRRLLLLPPLPLLPLPLPPLPSLVSGSHRVVQRRRWPRAGQRGRLGLLQGLGHPRIPLSSRRRGSCGADPQGLPPCPRSVAPPFAWLSLISSASSQRGPAWRRRGSPTVSLRPSLASMGRSGSAPVSTWSDRTCPPPSGFSPSPSSRRRLDGIRSWRTPQGGRMQNMEMIYSSLPLLLPLLPLPPLAPFMSRFKRLPRLTSHSLGGARGPNKLPIVRRSPCPFALLS